MRALRYYQEQDYAAALKGFEQLYETAIAEGDSGLAVRSLNNVGLCHYKLQNFGPAQQAFQKVIAQSPSYVFAYRNLARVYRAQGKTTEAEQLMQKAAEIERSQKQAGPGPGAEPF
jgi:tetratricopeptide (TPR) repeat protein